MHAVIELVLINELSLSGMFWVAVASNVASNCCALEQANMFVAKLETAEKMQDSRCKRGQDESLDLS